MELQQGRLKLEVPLNGEASSRIPSYAESQRRCLSRSLRRFAIAFEDVVQTAVEEPGCERFLVYNYEVDKKPFIPEEFATCYSSISQHYPEEISSSPKLFEINSNHSFGHMFFSGCFVSLFAHRSCHKAVPLTAIFFGNIQGGVFINHWEVRLSYIRRVIVDNAISEENARNRTRFHFELNCPVMIRRGLVNIINNHDSKIYPILSRIRLRTGIGIEFASLHVVDELYFAKFCLYGRWAKSEGQKINAVTSDPVMNSFIKQTVRKEDVAQVERNPSDIVKERRFSLKYLIECLISRGAVVKDQLLLKKTMWITFLKVINFCYLQAREACLCALERLITMIDERKRIGSIIKAFICEYEIHRSREAKSTLSWQEIRDGYRKVRKLVITPSRVIYTVPEVIMANRVLRMYDHDGTRMIRVTFRYIRTVYRFSNPLLYIVVAIVMVVLLRVNKLLCV
uniref:RNA-directed RNA polymerase n=1 Tax=Angiostrongylus cantonensis TaxID=6313 RepID=A0A0K0CZ05_ANGCA